MITARTTDRDARRALGGWTETHEYRGDEDDPPERGGADDDEEDEDEDEDDGSARDD